MADFTVEYDLARQAIVYREPRRSLLIRCEVDDGWWLRRETISWWDRSDGRHPVSPAEREMVIERVVADGRKGGRWIGVAGEPRPDRPPRPAEDEVGAFERYLEGAAPSAAASDPELLGWIEEALGALEPLAPQWDVAASITRQLVWCRGTVRGDVVEKAPGPLSMGLMATREFDMYGSQPELASLINRIQSAMVARGSAPG